MNTDLLDEKTKRFIESENIMSAFISRNKEARDSMTATITELDGYNFKDAQGIIDTIGDLE